jgi:hypothetical protein
MTSLRPVINFIPFTTATAPLLDKPIRDDLSHRFTTVVQNIAPMNVMDLKGIGGVRGENLIAKGIKTIGMFASVPSSVLPAGTANVQAALRAAMGHR